MCGIVGIVSKRKDKEDIVKKMNAKIIHRGPDDEGIYVDDGVALGHRRLAIIDLANGHQPMFNEDQSIVVVFNGEIYNYIELKAILKKKYKFQTNSDTEVLVYGYQEWGKELPKHLRGMFAFAIWDKNKEKLFMARDGFGIKPLYYYVDKDSLVFASEIKAILEYPDYHKELNDKILSAYLCFNSVPTTESFFKGICRVNPGEQISYAKGKITKKKFFHLEFDPKDGKLEDIAQDIEKAMKDSVEHHMLSDVEVGSFLSSGIDSSYLVCLAKPDKTYTVGYDDKRYDEISYAKDLTNKLGITNKDRKITKEEYIKAFPKIMYYMDEPLADPSAIALYFVAELASKDVKVVMSGEGADEFFGGYLNYLEEVNHSWYMKIPYFIRRGLSKIAGFFPDLKGFNFVYRRGRRLEEYNIGLGRVFWDREALNIVNVKNQVLPEEVVKETYQEYQNDSPLIQRQVIDYYYWLVNDFLHAVDRNTMMFGLEARTPFLDKEVYEVARKLPFYAKVNEETTKPALRMAAKKVIPNESYKKKKLGFPVPLREWIREDDLYGMIKEKFESETAKKYFKQKRILKLLEDHRKRKKDCYKKIWNVYTFLVWYDIYFEA